MPGASQANGRGIDWSRVSPRGQAIARTVVTSASQGNSREEIANGLGTSPFWVSKRIAELRELDAT
jgi:DNA-binding CsgD family transcriptional regulator